MAEHITIRNFGPLQDVVIGDMRPFTFFIGASGSGKSTILKVTAFMRWIYKMMSIRSYLYYSGIKSSPFKLNFKHHLNAMGLAKFLRTDTFIEYHCGSFIFKYDKGIRFPKRYIPQEELSLEKVSFISDKRTLIGEILENNFTMKKRAFYANETFDDYLIATDAIKHYEMPSLGVSLQVKKTSNGEKHLIESLTGGKFSINLYEASSGTQSSIPLAIIVEYFSKKYDIVESLNDAVFRYASKSDSLKDFRASRNVGELPNRRVSLFIEEPEISLYPPTQLSLMDSLVANCNYASNYEMNLMIATHSPYIINHLNVLLRRKGQPTYINACDIAVYSVAGGRLYSLMAKDEDSGEYLVDTDDLSEPMETIFEEYSRLGI